MSRYPKGYVREKPPEETIRVNAPPPVKLPAFVNNPSKGDYTEYRVAPDVVKAPLSAIAEHKAAANARRAKKAGKR